MWLYVTVCGCMWLYVACLVYICSCHITLGTCTCQVTSHHNLSLALATPVDSDPLLCIHTNSLMHPAPPPPPRSSRLMLMSSRSMRRRQVSPTAKAKTTTSCTTWETPFTCCCYNMRSCLHSATWGRKRTAPVGGARRGGAVVYRCTFLFCCHVPSLLLPPRPAMHAVGFIASHHLEDVSAWACCLMSVRCLCACRQLLMLCSHV